MKILVYSNCALDPTLGSGKTRSRFSAGLRARGHDVRVVEPVEFEFWPGARGGKRFRLAWGAWRHCRKALAREAVDIVEINGGEFGWLARSLRRRQRRPLVVHRTDGCELLAQTQEQSTAGTAPSRPGRWSARAHQALDVAAFRDADASVTLSSADSVYLGTTGWLPPDRIRVIPPGMDHEYLDNPPPEKRLARIAFLGSWIERKGVDAFLAAAIPLLVEHPAVELDLLGTGVAPAWLKAKFPASLGDRVQVAGRLTPQEISRRLGLAGIFVLPSRYEGYGMATAEAMACGCAVITTRTGFGAGLIAGEEALLVSIDAPDELRRAMERLVRDADLRLRLATNGWRRVQEQSWDRSVGALEAAYLGWLAPQRVRAS